MWWGVHIKGANVVGVRPDAALSPQAAVAALRSRSTLVVALTLPYLKVHTYLEYLADLSLAASPNAVTIEWSINAGTPQFEAKCEDKIKINGSMD